MPSLLSGSLIYHRVLMGKLPHTGQRLAPGVPRWTEQCDPVVLMSGGGEVAGGHAAGGATVFSR